MTENLKNVLEQFLLEGTGISCQRYGHGHINETYLVVTDTGKRYILQRINHNIFKDVSALMNNIRLVTTYLGRQAQDPRQVLQLVNTRGGDAFLCHTDGSYWRVYVFVEGSICLQKPESGQDFYESAVAFGRFQQMLKDFPADTLTETIPNFHNTPDRYRIFHEVLERDPLDRGAQVRQEIDFLLSREQEAGVLVELMDSGQLPLRVTHNDTKLNNVMLDAKTRKALCVIDLDTVMPGLSLYDFGDSIRFGAATGDEDERNLAKIEMSLGLYETYTRGFLSACPGLTEMEKEMLPTGAKLMTLECGLRFLTDYLDGDHYFANRRPGQNLDRCRTQLKLVEDMEKKWEQMHRIVKYHTL